MRISSRCVATRTAFVLDMVASARIVCAPGTQPRMLRFAELTRAFVLCLTQLYLVMDRAAADLHYIVRSSQHLAMEQISFICYQIMLGLRFIHSAGIIHRDLKPSNILVDANCAVRIADFGLARSNALPNEPMTEYVLTRWYRAPEVMLQRGAYSEAVDVWSAGCILAELCNRRPMFAYKASHDPLSFGQLSEIINKIGSLSDAEMDTIADPTLKQYLMRLPRRPSRPRMADLVPNGPHELLEHILVTDPDMRATIPQILEDPFFAPWNVNLTNLAGGIVDASGMWVAPPDAMVHAAMLDEVAERLDGINGQANLAATAAERVQAMDNVAALLEVFETARPGCTGALAERVQDARRMWRTSTPFTDDEHEAEELNLARVRAHLYAEMMLYHPETAAYVATDAPLH